MKVPSTSDGRSALQVATGAAHAAGRIILERFSEPMKVSHKGVGQGDLVTDVDLAAERAVLDALRSAYPDFGVLSEESPEVQGSAPFTWIVDPLDGTRNYSALIPHACVSIGLAHEDEVQVGVIYEPFRGEWFVAQRGKGARLNGRPMRVSQRGKLADCLIGFDIGYSKDRARWTLDLMRGLWPDFLSMRIMGSSALGLAYAACGRIDLYFHSLLSAWDLAAGVLLVEEAGGVVRSRSNGPLRLRGGSVAASSPALLDEFMRRTEGSDWRTAPDA